MNKDLTIQRRIGYFFLFLGWQMLIFMFVGNAKDELWIQLINYLFAYTIAYYGAIKCLSLDETSLTKDKHLLFKTLGLRFLSLFGAIIGYRLILFALGIQQTVSDNQASLNSLLDSPLRFVFLLVMGIAIAPFIEEFCFRYLMLYKVKHQKVMMLISALLFALVHMIGQSFNLYWVTDYIQYFIIGIFFVYNFVKSQSYKQSVLLHSLWNFVSVMLMVISTLIK